MGNLFHRGLHHIRRTDYMDNQLLDVYRWDRVLVEGAPNTYASSIDNDVILTEIGTLGKVGWLMNNAGDAIQAEWIPPFWHDYFAQLNVRVRYATGSVDPADTIDWVVTYKPISGEENEAFADPATALDKVIPQDTVGSAANVPRYTDFGVIEAGKIPFGSSLLFKVTMNAKAAGLTENIYFLGLQIEASATRRGAVNHAL